MQNIESSFVKLRNSMNKIKSLRAWRQLKESENQHISARLIIPNTAEQDMYNELLFVDYTIEQIEMMLKKAENIVSKPLEKYQRQLDNFRQEFSKLKPSKITYPENYFGGI